MSTTKDSWEYFGETDPYYSVATHDKFRKANLDESARAEFFSSGEEYVNRVWQEIEAGFVPGFRPNRSLDFGCGVGRLLLPIATRSENAIGVDVSEAMLREARVNVERCGAGNVGVMTTAEFMSAPGLDLDLVHSSIVFQHIPPSEGEAVLDKILNDLRAGGVGVLQFTVRIPLSGFAWVKFRAYRDLPGIYKAKSLIRGNAQPFMPIYEYDVSRLLTQLKDHGCHKISLRFSDHGSHGIVLMFQKVEIEQF